MDSPFFMKRFFILLLASACIGGARALDIAFDRLQCDESLPVYADSKDIVMTCSDGSSNRCTFGQETNIRGTCKWKYLKRFPEKSLTSFISYPLLTCSTLSYSAILWYERNI